jgi:molecular chaperone GrpE
MSEEKNLEKEQEELIDKEVESAASEQEKESENQSDLSEEEKKNLEIQALNDKYLRLYSEFDNFRRRTQKEKLELYKTAGEDIFKSLLPVMDDFERAKKSMEETQNYDSLKEGVDLIYNKLLNVFKANGAEPMESSIGKDFDSEIHEAITQIPAPDKKMKGKVVDEIEKGYTLKEKVIRYAKVVVGQ